MDNINWMRSRFTCLLSLPAVALRAFKKARASCASFPVRRRISTDRFTRLIEEAWPDADKAKLQIISGEEHARVDFPELT
jgi:hypothetical protein